MEERVSKVVEKAGQFGITIRAISSGIREPIGRVRTTLAKMEKAGKVVRSSWLWYTPEGYKQVDKTICWCGLKLQKQRILLLEEDLETEDELVCPVHGYILFEERFDSKNLFQMASIKSMMNNWVRPTVFPSRKYSQ